LGRSLILDVADWAAIVSGEAEEQFGAAEPASALPAKERRRLPAFSRDVLRCALPLVRDRPRCPVVLSSPHGDMPSTVTLLTDIARRELLSPALFGLSVHNAPAGALSICLDQPGDQTSLAGDEASLSAGLIETYARLATQEAQSVVLIYAEEQLPAIYAELDEKAPGVFLAMQLRLARATAASQIAVGLERAGAVAVVRALAAGLAQLRFPPPRWQARAAA
jgi:hypothetical protein